MPIFTENMATRTRYDDDYDTFSEGMMSSYDSIGDILYENAINDNKIFNALIASDFAELAYMQESAGVDKQSFKDKMATKRDDIKDRATSFKNDFNSKEGVGGKAKFLFDSLIALLQKVGKKIIAFLREKGEKIIEFVRSGFQGNLSTFEKLKNNNNLGDCKIHNYRKKDVKKFDEIVGDNIFDRILKMTPGQVIGNGKYVQAGKTDIKNSAFNNSSSDANKADLIKNMISSEFMNVNGIKNSENINFGVIEKAMVSYVFDDPVDTILFKNISVMSVDRLIKEARDDANIRNRIKKAQKAAKSIIDSTIAELNKAKRKKEGDANFQKSVRVYCNALTSVVNVVSKAQLSLIATDAKQNYSMLRTLLAYANTQDIKDKAGNLKDKLPKKKVAQENALYIQSCYLEAVEDFDKAVNHVHTDEDDNGVCDICGEPMDDDDDVDINININVDD